MRKKSHAADNIISLIKQWEVLYDHKVRKLRSDHGIEFINTSQEDFFFFQSQESLKTSLLLELLNKMA